MRELRTFEGVMEALGGFEGVQRITGARPTAISNWRSRGEQFPARHFIVIADALARADLCCARSLFTFQRKAKANGKRKRAA
jgi:hypothetical protein